MQAPGTKGWRCSQCDGDASTTAAASTNSTATPTIRMVAAQKRHRQGKCKAWRCQECSVSGGWAHVRGDLRGCGSAHSEKPITMHDSLRLHATAEGGALTGIAACIGRVAVLSSTPTRTPARFCAPRTAATCRCHNLPKCTRRMHRRIADAGRFNGQDVWADPSGITSHADAPETLDSSFRSCTEGTGDTPLLYHAKVSTSLH